MFVSIVLNTEYMSVSSRTKWYLKNLLHCKDNAWILITHQSLLDNWESLQKEVTDSLFDSWEMRPFSMEELADVEQYAVPDSIFEKKDAVCGSHTEELLEISQHRWPDFERCIESIINQIKARHAGEKIDGILHCMEAFESLHRISSEMGIPLISYAFSAIRRPHGYRQTLYFSNFGRLFCADECEKRFSSFQADSDGLPMLDRREIIALLGKERTLPLIPLMESEPDREVCVCGEGFQVLPHIFSRMPLTDDDLFYEYGKLYPKDRILSRQHPIHLDQIGVERSMMRNDPASTVLRCRRLAAGCSQIILKAMIWNRTAVMPLNTIPLSFMCEKAFDSTEKVSLSFLNYYLFGYLIPAGLLFDDRYWRWRLAGPDEREIYLRHLQFICQDLHLDGSILTIPQGNARFEALLRARGIDRDLFDSLSVPRSGDLCVDFDVASSKFEIAGRTFWRLNTVKDGRICSRIRVYGTEVKSFRFYPYDDVAGVSRMIEVRVNGIPVESVFDGKPVYMPKNRGCYVYETSVADGEEVTIECIWEKIPVNSFLETFCIN